MERIEQEWRDYVSRVFEGDTISKIQYQNMREAFYAGLIVLLGIMQNEVSGMPEGEGIKFLEKLKAELWGFRNEIKMRIEAENNSEKV